MRLFLGFKLAVNALSRFSDPHHFNADPDPACYFIADLDPAFHFNADSDLAPHQGDANLSLLAVSTPPFLDSRSSTALFEPRNLLNFDLYASPDPAFHSNGGSGSSFQKHCGSGTLVLSKLQCQDSLTLYLGHPRHLLDE